MSAVYSWRMSDQGGLLGRVLYRRAGRTHAACEAVYDPTMCPDPGGLLAERLGAFVMFKVFPPGGQPSAPGLPPPLAGAMAQTGGVLPLVPKWLHANYSALFTSHRVAERLLAELADDELPPGYRMSVYSVVGQFRTSKVLIRDDVSDPAGALARLLGARLTKFKPAPAQNL